MPVFSLNRSEESAAGLAGALSLVAHGTTFVGELQSDNVVKIEGRFEGSVRANRQVLVTHGGVVQGDISAPEAVIGGEVHGDIVATERVQLLVGARVLGNVTAPRLIVQEGGLLNGQLRMAGRATGAESHSSRFLKTA